MHTDPPKPSEYQEESTTHAGAALAAELAVSEQSKKTNRPFKLAGIVKAESQQLWSAQGSPSGTNWRLGLEVTAEEGQSSFVEATVSVDPYANYRLTRWADSSP